MIIDFEEYTEELSDVERRDICPLMIRYLKRCKGKASTVTNKDLRKMLSDDGLDIYPSRIRKIIHAIRMSGAIRGLCATSKGYYIATTNKEWFRYRKSLTQRIRSIQSILDIMDEQYEEWLNE